jgi:hypothetical protein
MAIAVDRRAYWLHFAATLDQPSDAAILKELLFWTSIHPKDCFLRVVIGSPGEDDYFFQQKISDVTETPCLVISDRGDHPAAHLKLTRGFFSPDIVGHDYSRLGYLLETMHSLLIRHGSLASLSEDLLHARVATGLTRVWTEMKGLIQLTTSAQPYPPCKGVASGAGVDLENCGVKISG